MRPQSPTTPPAPTFIHKKGRNSGNSLFSMKLTRKLVKYYFPQKGICEVGGRGMEGENSAGGHFHNFNWLWGAILR